MIQKLPRRPQPKKMWSCALCGWGLYMGIHQFTGETANTTDRKRPHVFVRKPAPTNENKEQ